MLPVYRCLIQTNIFDSLHHEGSKLQFGLKFQIVLKYEILNVMMTSNDPKLMCEYIQEDSLYLTSNF